MAVRLKMVPEVRLALPARLRQSPPSRRLRRLRRLRLLLLPVLWLLLGQLVLRVRLVREGLPGR